jgi:hypothetical protein
MKNLNLKKILLYFYDKLTGSFMGFLIATLATGLVSRYFETRSIKNLWGLTSKKRIVDKATFSQLEWIISVCIGFIVFEIITKVIKKKLDRELPKYKIAVMRWIIRKELHLKFRKLSRG